MKKNIEDKIFFKGLRTHLVGAYIRYYFFKLIGKERSLAHLRGDADSWIKSFIQFIFNEIIGIVFLILLIFAGAFIYYFNKL